MLCNHSNCVQYSISYLRAIEATSSNDTCIDSTLKSCNDPVSRCFDYFFAENGARSFLSTLTSHSRVGNVLGLLGGRLCYVIMLQVKPVAGRASCSAVRLPVPAYWWPWCWQTNSRTIRNLSQTGCWLHGVDILNYFFYNIQSTWYVHLPSIFSIYLSVVSRKIMQNIPHRTK